MRVLLYPNSFKCASSTEGPNIYWGFFFLFPLHTGDIIYWALLRGVLKWRLEWEQEPLCSQNPSRLSVRLRASLLISLRLARLPSLSPAGGLVYARTNTRTSARFPLDARRGWRAAPSVPLCHFHSALPPNGKDKDLRSSIKSQFTTAVLGVWLHSSFKPVPGWIIFSSFFGDSGRVGGLLAALSVLSPNAEAKTLWFLRLLSEINQKQ